MKKINISIIFPFYNEEKRLKNLFSSIKNIQKNLFINCEFIFVNDGSTDHSYNLIKYFLKKNKIKNYFVYPANFWSHKNHLNLIKGFYYFNRKNNNNYQLILVGNIIDRIVYKKIINFINEEDLQPYIKIMGFVDRKDLLTLYDNCIALSYLSVSGPENLPPLEAFARGKPVLYSNFKAAKEQLKNYPLYINYKNPLDIAKGMKIILMKKKFSKIYIKFARSKDTTIYISKVNSVLEKLK